MMTTLPLTHLARTLELLLGLLIIANISVITEAGPDLSVEFSYCNGAVFGPGDPSGPALPTLLGYLVGSTPGQATKSFYLEAVIAGTDSYLYGYADCTQRLSTDECHLCMEWARADISGACPQATGAEILLGDCRMRYETYPFV